MANSNVFSMRLTPEERQLAESYAKLHAMATALLWATMQHLAS